jgi:membrane glycosyltransferase
MTAPPILPMTGMQGGLAGVAAPAKDASDARLLPPEAPLAMPAQNFSQRKVQSREPRRRGYWVPRAAVVFGTWLLTAAFAHELYQVLSYVQMTPIQAVFLFLSTISFGWIAFGSLSAAMGFLPLFADETADTLEPPGADGTLSARTALLFPVYHEDVARISGTIGAMAEEIAARGRSASFDVFVLSDTRGAEAGELEQKAYTTLAAALKDKIAVYYRRRIENTAKKAGNIKDWVERFGAAYDHFIILDGDSVMSGDTVIRLARAMEAEPKAGLIQTVPRLTGSVTILQRLQQFASNVYGPSVATGIASWHRDQGNYWGHNAIIRTRAFAGDAGLPELTGRKPFGGHILSHDFVEAVLLQRGGWSVHMVPSLQGSYEGTPPALAEVITRDRRWAQGNLQHMALIPRAGLTAMGRVHLTMGAFSYLVSAIWALSLAVGLVLALQSQQIIPSYFQDSKTLFPLWPTIDPGAAMRLFLATMGVVLLPKLLGLILEVKRSAKARELFGWPRAIGAVATETLFSMLLAPILMMTQTSGVYHILRGRDTGWSAQSRDSDTISLADAFSLHRRHTFVGLGMALICWYVSPGLLVWMLPVIAGLVLSGPLNWLTAQPAGPVMTALLATTEDRDPPPVLKRAEELTEHWRQKFSGKPALEAVNPGAIRTAA